MLQYLHKKLSVKYISHTFIMHTKGFDFMFKRKNKDETSKKSATVKTDAYSTELHPPIPSCFCNDCIECNIITEIGNCDCCPFFSECSQSLIFRLDY